MNVTVYSGASPDADERFLQAARDVGEWIGGSGHSLVYGAGATGLMGAVYRATRDAGGQTFGVIPGFLAAEQTPPDDLTRLEIVADMPARKARMIELGDVFVALPGGPGTLEELAEILGLIKLRLVDGPLVLYNVDGFYDTLAQLLRDMLAQNFMDEDTYTSVKLVNSIAELAAVLKPEEGACSM